jgi:Lipase (class 3)
MSMSRWIEKQESYSNSSFDGIELEPFVLSVLVFLSWTSINPHRSPNDFLLVNLAAICADEVYARKDQAATPPKGFDILKEVNKMDAGNANSSSKATTVVLYKPHLDSPESRNVVVVAIRGTASVHDWMVNLNDGSDTPTADKFLGNDANDVPFRVHSGFLACAKGMLLPVVGALANALEAAKKTSPASKAPVLLFAGHSAGGAVATLLYGHIMKVFPLLRTSKFAICLFLSLYLPTQSSTEYTV